MKAGDHDFKIFNRVADRKHDYLVGRGYSIVCDQIRSTVGRQSYIEFTVKPPGKSYLVLPTFKPDVWPVRNYSACALPIDAPVINYLPFCYSGTSWSREDTE